MTEEAEAAEVSGQRDGTRSRDNDSGRLETEHDDLNSAKSSNLCLIFRVSADLQVV